MLFQTVAGGLKNIVLRVLLIKICDKKSSEEKLQSFNVLALMELEVVGIFE